MNLFIYGSGGVGCEVVDIALRTNNIIKKWNNIYFVDDIRIEREHYGISVFHFDEMLQEIHDYECIIAMGEPAYRRDLYEKLQHNQVKLATVIDDTAIISPTAVIGSGCIIGPYSFISSHTILDENIMLEIKTIIGHDITIGKHSVISSGCVVGGNASIGKESFIGLNSTIKERVNIGNNSIIGMQTSVFSDIGDGLIALGNPARVILKNDQQSVFKR